MESKDAYLMTAAKPHITCIGLANVDVIANVSEEFIAENNIAKGASTVLDSCQTGNLLSKLERPELFPGGCAANTACGLSLLGIDTRFIGKTGDDIYAEIFRKGFNDHNVVFDTPHHGMKMTSTCLTFLTPDKNRSFGICLDTAGWYLDKHDLPDIPDDSSQSLYLEANAVKIPPNALPGESLLEEAVARYAGSNVNLFINLNDWEIVLSARDRLRAMLEKQVTFFIGNIHELYALFDLQDMNDALAAAAQTGRSFAVTCGAEGAYVVRDGKISHVPAAPLHVSRIINTLGAGDQFAAGFIASYVSGLSVTESCANGIDAATEILQRKSARPDPKNFKVKLRDTAVA